MGCSGRRLLEEKRWWGLWERASWDARGTSYSHIPWSLTPRALASLLGRYLASFPWLIGCSIRRPSEGHQLHAQRTHTKPILVVEAKTEPSHKDKPQQGGPSRTADNNPLYACHRASGGNYGAGRGGYPARCEKLRSRGLEAWLGRPAKQRGGTGHMGPVAASGFRPGAG